MIVIKKRSVMIRGRRTSVSMEDTFWDYLVKHCEVSETTISRTLERIESRKPEGQGLSSAIRVFCMQEATR